MVHKSLCLLLLALLFVTFANVMDQRCHAYPEPAIVAKAWEFDFSFDLPRPISFTTPDGRVRWFWYLTYRITNNTDRERLFIPEITIATDEGDILLAGRSVPPGVFEAITAQLPNHLIESPIQVVGKLLLGPDNAKDSLAIWPADEHEIDTMSVFIGGLSGETAVVQNPVSKEDVLMTKTLMIDLALPGEPPNPQHQPVILQEQHWVMR